MKDNAESSLYRAVLDGEPWAVCFYCKTQAKDRGYTERVEQYFEGAMRMNVSIDDVREGIAQVEAYRRERFGTNERFNMN
jgi:hypothetical protein